MYPGDMIYLGKNKNTPDFNSLLRGYLGGGAMCFSLGSKRCFFNIMNVNNGNNMIN